MDATNSPAAASTSAALDAARQELIAETTRGTAGRAALECYADRVDTLLQRLFFEAPAPTQPVAVLALGGCWTHIGCAQSVVAYAFIQRDVDERYTPVQWIRDITPVIVKILVVLTALIYLEGALLTWL